MPIRRTARALLALPVCVALGSVVIGATWKRPTPPCQITEAWVRQHRTSLPSTLAEISRYPLAFRKAIVAHVSADVRVRLWREKLDFYLAPSSNLSPAQRELVQHIRDELYVLVSDSTGKLGRERMASEGLHDRIASLFDSAQRRAIFGTVGLAKMPADSIALGALMQLSLIERADRSILLAAHKSLAPLKVKMSYCDCIYDWECDNPNICAEPNDHVCENVFPECGDLGDEYCTGVCG